MKFGVKKLERCFIIWCEIYFDNLNGVGVAYECDGRRNGRTDIMAFRNSALQQRYTRAKIS